MDIREALETEPAPAGAVNELRGVRPVNENDCRLAVGVPTSEIVGDNGPPCPEIARDLDMEALVGVWTVLDAIEVLLDVRCREAKVDPNDAELLILDFVFDTGPETDRVEILLVERLDGIPGPTRRDRPGGPTMELGLLPLLLLIDNEDTARMRREAAVDSWLGPATWLPASLGVREVEGGRDRKLFILSMLMSHNSLHVCSKRSFSDMTLSSSIISSTARLTSSIKAPVKPTRLDNCS